MKRLVRRIRSSLNARTKSTKFYAYIVQHSISKDILSFSHTSLGSRLFDSLIFCNYFIYRQTADIYANKYLRKHNLTNFYIENCSIKYSEKYRTFDVACISARYAHYSILLRIRGLFIIVTQSQMPSVIPRRVMKK